MRNLYELIIITKLKNFDQINRLIYSTETAVSDNYCGVFDLNFNISNLVFNIPDLALLYIKTTVDFFELYFYFFLYFFELFVYFFFYFFESSVYFLLYLAELKGNKYTLTQKLFSYSLIIRIEYPVENRKTSIDIFKR